MAANERELKLKLTIDVPDSSKPSRAFQDIAKEASKAGAAVQDANRQMQRFGNAPGMGSPGGSAIQNASPWMAPPRYYQQPTAGWSLPPQAGGGGSFNGQAPVGGSIAGFGGVKGIGGAIGAAGALAAAGAVAQTFANIVEAGAKMEDSALTTSQRFSEVAKIIPVFGGALSSLTSSLTSAASRIYDWKTSASLDAQQRRQPGTLAAIQLNSTADERIRGMRRDAREYDFGIGARERFPSLAVSEQGGAAIAGFGAFATAETRDPRLTGAMEAVRDAQRAADEANRSRAGAFRDEARYRQSAIFWGKQVGYENRKVNEAGREAGIADYGGVDSPQAMLKVPAYQKALLDQELAITKQKIAQQQLLESAERLGQKTLAHQQKLYEVSKAETAVMKVRADLLNDELTRSRAGAQQFGAMDSVAQRGLVDAVDRFKKGGRDFVSAQELAGLQQFAPDVIGKELEKSAGASPLLAYIQKQLGIRDAATISGELVKLKADITAKVELDEVKFKKVMKEGVEESAGKIETIIKAIVATEITAFENRTRQGRAN